MRMEIRRSKRTETPKAVLLIDVESNDADKLADACGKVAALIPSYNAEALLAGDSHERAQFWSERKQLGAIAKHTNAFKLNEDVVIPLDKLPDFADFIERINFEKELQNVLRCINRDRPSRLPTLRCFISGIKSIFPTNFTGLHFCARDTRLSARHIALTGRLRI
jgi:FAD/FMN-containing dehydrogenase